MIPAPPDRRGRAEHALEVFKGVLAAFERLPEAERRPRIARPERRLVDPSLVLDPPAGTLKLRTFHRVLEQDDQGQYQPSPAQRWTSVVTNDVVWVSEAEWRSLVPADPKKGSSFALPAPLRNRIVKYGFHPFYMLENGVDRWVGSRPENIRRAGLTVTVTAVDRSEVVLEVEGPILVEQRDYVMRGTGKTVPTGFEGRVRGVLVHDRTRGQFTRFDLVAIGDYWGAAAHNGIQPRTPVGFALELATGEWAADHIHPERVRRQAGVRHYLEPIE